MAAKTQPTIVTIPCMTFAAQPRLHLSVEQSGPLFGDSLSQENTSNTSLEPHQTAQGGYDQMWF